MEEVRKLTQAYDQAPWRKQLQLIAVFLLVLVTVAIIAGIYLSVTAQAATIGRQIQEMQIRMYGSYRIDIIPTPTLESLNQIAQAKAPKDGEDVVPIEELRIQIAELETRLAASTSEGIMREKALSMGFVPTTSESVVYIKVPGYQGRQTANLAPPPSPITTNTTTLSSAYKESLIDWLTHELNLASRQFSSPNKSDEEVRP